MSQKPEAYPRFRLGARIEHAILMISFTVLAVTGLPQKYAAAGWAEWTIDLFGGIEMIRIIHRVAAFVLTVGSVYHLFTSAYRSLVKRERMQMIPTRKDLDDLIATVRHNLGFQPHPPRMAKFNFGEKFEYWAVVWGTAIMALTGFVLWNPLAIARILPGSIIPAAKAAHGGEAVLAVAAILIWHLYSVLIKDVNPSMFTGKMSRRQMEEEHALELERLDRGESPWPELELEVLQRRRVLFAIGSVLIGGIALAFVIWAITFEETAITTIPRATIEAFSPLLTPAP